MKIRLAEYKQDVPTRVEMDYNPRELELEFVDLRYLTPLHMDGTVEKAQDTVTFRGTLGSRVEQMCGRCLAKNEAPLSRDFELYYEIKGLEVIDTIDDLREVLLLEHPLVYVCNENCLGLCPHCKSNRNETHCRCEETLADKPISHFKDIWNKKKGE